MPGLQVEAKQTYYPIELSNSELLAHYNAFHDYIDEISHSALVDSKRTQPSHELISQQPEVNPLLTRQQTVEYIYEICFKTRVTNCIFYQAVRLFDRYCSKRIVLRDQLQLVACTCVWLCAKSYGGCNHIINNVSIPTGGRFYGPNVRSRIPRLSELIFLCSDAVDESMFLQMEKHILATLEWNIVEPTMNDYVLHVDENNMIQYEWYQKQLELTGAGGDASIDTKIEHIHLKKFLIDLSCWSFELLKYEMHEVAQGIFSVLDKYEGLSQESMLRLPHSNNVGQIHRILVDLIVNKSLMLLKVSHERVAQFVMSIKQQRQERTIGLPSPPYNTKSPLVYSNADSIFTTSSGQESPITPVQSRYRNVSFENYGKENHDFDAYMPPRGKMMDSYGSAQSSVYSLSVADINTR